MRKNYNEMTNEEFEKRLHRVDKSEDVKNASYLVYLASYMGVIGLVAANKAGSKIAKATASVAVGASLIAGGAQMVIQRNYKLCRGNMAYAESKDAVQREGVVEIVKDKVNKNDNTYNEKV